jgi:molybdate transport system substrate-binding protein
MASTSDPMWTDELAKHQLVKPETVADLVSNHLVLIAKKGSGPPGAMGGELALVRMIGVGPVAMCDPDSHPAGRMAKASLTALGLWDSVSAKVARTENPLLAVKMVARGDAPYAVVFTTDAMADPGVDVVAAFADDSHPPIRYPVAILTKSTNPNAARFLDYLKSPAAGEIFRRLGYVTLGK